MALQRRTHFRSLSAGPGLVYALRGRSWRHGDLAYRDAAMLHGRKKGRIATVCSHADKSSGAGDAEPPRRAIRPDVAPSEKNNSSSRAHAAEDTPDNTTPNTSPEGLGLLLQRAKTFWEGLTPQQQAYTALVGVLLLVAGPKVLMVLLLGVERVLIGALLAAEEVLLQLLLKAGVVVSGVLGLALVAGGIYLFTQQKATR